MPIIVQQTCTNKIARAISFFSKHCSLYHVLAKRYLCRNKKYYSLLSDASRISLKLQGGILNKKESNEFEKKIFFKNAIKLRKFDELAKKTNIKIKSINDYKDLLSSQLL